MQVCAFTRDVLGHDYDDHEDSVSAICLPRCDDSGADVPVSTLQALNLYGRNRLFGIGPDVTMAIFQRGGTIGLVNVRYLWESGGKRSFQDGTFVVGLTIARPKVN